MDGWRVLDVGCGTGIYTARLAANEAVHFVGIDVAPAAILRQNVILQKKMSLRACWWTKKVIL